jgi:hypothetical protein
MSQGFSAGDYLVFQLESGYGLLRVLAADGEGAETVWHVGVYEELFPDIETAEKDLLVPDSLHFNNPHLALTDRAFERTPAAKLGHRPLEESELAGYRVWQSEGHRQVFDRSLLLLLGMR